VLKCQPVVAEILEMLFVLVKDSLRFVIYFRALFESEFSEPKDSEEELTPTFFVPNSVQATVHRHPKTVSKTHSSQVAIRPVKNTDLAKPTVSGYWHKPLSHSPTNVQRTCLYNRKTMFINPSMFIS
jgi:hypothetical protein